MIKQLLITIYLLFFINVYSQSNKKIKLIPINNINSITKKIKNNQIIGLGEGTHGTKDFNDVRIEISKNLINKHNFTVIAFEQAFGDSYFLNKGINSNEDIKAVMRNNLLSIWQTVEFENFFLWIRNYNLKHKNKIIVTGFDTNLLNNSSLVLKNSKINTDKNYLKLVNKLDSLSLKIDESWLQSNNPEFKSNMDTLVKIGAEGYEISKKIDSLYLNHLDSIEKIALTNLLLGFQNFYDSSMGNYDFDRDIAMAKNIEKIQKELNSKVIIIAHNAHIALQPTLVTGMGKFLRDHYPNNYYSLGTYTISGTYSAINDNIVLKNNVLNSYIIPSLYENSWEEMLNKLSPKDYFIDFKENLTFPKNKLVTRFFGYKPYDIKDEKYLIMKPISLAKIFDGIIFIRNSKASREFDRV